MSQGERRVEGERRIGGEQSADEGEELMNKEG